MSGKNKNTKTSISDFIRYRRNEMSDKERNAFERELQKDPFAMEASEGFEELLPGTAKEDLSLLANRLKQMTSGKNRMIYYRIAASVAMLMIISTIFIVVDRNRSPEQLSKSLTPAPPIEMPESLPVDKPAENKKEIPELVTPSVTREERLATAKAGNKKVQQEIETKNEKVTAENVDAVAVAETKDYDDILAEVKPPARKSALAKSRSEIDQIIRGKVISSEDSKPIPGVTITIKGTSKGTITDSAGNFTISLVEAAGKTLVADFIGMQSREFMTEGDTNMEIRLEPSISALGEIVVVGYGAKKTGDEEQFTPPMPVSGKAAFNRYIDENIVTPGMLKDGERVVVVISFLVRTNGAVDSIKIVKSPGQTFSDEAIRLLKEGPQWKPAIENGKEIEDEVRIRIVFR